MQIKVRWWDGDYALCDRVGEEGEEKRDTVIVQCPNPMCGARVRIERVWAAARTVERDSSLFSGECGRCDMYFSVEMEPGEEEV